jgi:ketosteroid isomerase-like protein
MSASQIVRRFFAAFETKDREVADSLLDEHFTFTSQYDDHIDKAEYFERCWPNSDKLRDFQIEKLFEQGDEVFVRYRVVRTEDGVAFRNTEYIRCVGGRMVEVQVYFGADEKGH